MEAARIIAILTEEYKEYSNKLHGQLALCKDLGIRRDLLNQINGADSFMMKIHNRIAMESLSNFNHTSLNPKHEKNPLPEIVK